MFGLELNPLVTSVLVALISGIVSPIFLSFVNKFLNRKADKVDYATTLQNMTTNMANDLEEERNARRDLEKQHKKEIGDMKLDYDKKISNMQSEINRLLSLFQGPLKMITETTFTIQPTPEVLETEAYITPLNHQAIPPVIKNK